MIYIYLYIIKCTQQRVEAYIHQLKINVKAKLSRYTQTQPYQPLL